MFPFSLNTLDIDLLSFLKYHNDMDILPILYHLNTYKERIKLQKLPAKAKSKANRNKLKREQYKWLKRAELVGIDKLPAKRPTAGQKKAWQDKIIAAEKKASQSQQE